MMKKALVILLTVAMIFSMLSTAAFASTSFSDMPNDWSIIALEKAVENGLLSGWNGKIMPKLNLTRAQMAVVMNRAFGAIEKASLQAYTDVPSSAWYYDDMAKAVQMKTMIGNAEKLSPGRDMTRQEVFVALANAFKLSGGDPAVLDRFTDRADIDNWARDSIASLVSAGYAAGSNSRLNPAQNITRAELAQLMHNLVKNYISSAGTYTKVSKGNLMINVPDVTLKDVTIQGDLILGDGVQDGDITLDNVKVTGRTLLRGGGINTVKVVGNSDLGTVIISKVNGNIRVFTSDGAQIDTIVIDDGLENVIIEGSVGAIEITVGKVPVILRNAQVQSVAITAPNADVTLDDGTKVESILVSNSAGSSGITAGQGSSVARITTQAANTYIKGSGNVAAVEAQEGSDGTAVTTPNTNVSAGEKTSGVTAGGRAVAPGSSLNTSAGSTGSGSIPSGGDSGSGTVPVAVASISVTPAAITLKPGGMTAAIEAAVLPSNATNKNINWSSSNSSVAAVDSNGLITSGEAGNAVITAVSAANSAISATIEVTVAAAEEEIIPAEWVPGEVGIYEFPDMSARSMSNEDNDALKMLAKEYRLYAEENWISLQGATLINLSLEEDSPYSDYPYDNFLIPLEIVPPSGNFDLMVITLDGTKYRATLDWIAPSKTTVGFKSPEGAEDAFIPADDDEFDIDVVDFSQVTLDQLMDLSSEEHPEVYGIELEITGVNLSVDNVKKAFITPEYGIVEEYDPSGGFNSLYVTTEWQTGIVTLFYVLDDDTISYTQIYVYSVTPKGPVVSGLTFNDENTSAGIISGRLTWALPENSEGIDGYKIYFVDGSGNTIAPAIGTVSAENSSFDIPETLLPDTAVYLAVVCYKDGAEFAFDPEETLLQIPDDGDSSFPPEIDSVEDKDINPGIDGRDFTVNWTPSNWAYEKSTQEIYILPAGSAPPYSDSPVSYNYLPVASGLSNDMDSWTGDEKIVTDSTGNAFEETEYDVWVVVVNSSGTWIWVSTPFSKTPMADPEPLSIISARVYTDDLISLLLLTNRPIQDSPINFDYFQINGIDANGFGTGIGNNDNSFWINFENSIDISNLPLLLTVQAGAFKDLQGTSNSELTISIEIIEVP